jgi:hypothetical protein
MLNRPMLFTVLALTVVAAATATAAGAAEKEGSVSGPPAPPTGDSDSTLSLHGRALAITAGADACTGTSAGLPAAECSAWLDLYDKNGGPSWAHCSSNRLDPCSCTWFGVVCTDGHITKLALYRSNMVGTVPVELSAMTKLTYLSLGSTG